MISKIVLLNSAISPKDPATAVVPAVAVDPEAAVDPEVAVDPEATADLMTFPAVITKMTLMVAATTISQLRIVTP